MPFFKTTVQKSCPNSLFVVTLLFIYSHKTRFFLGLWSYIDQLVIKLVASPYNLSKSDKADLLICESVEFIK